jgi:hypothetical protein
MEVFPQCRYFPRHQQKLVFHSLLLDSKLPQVPIHYFSLPLSKARYSKLALVLLAVFLTATSASPVASPQYPIPINVIGKCQDKYKQESQNEELGPPRLVSGARIIRYESKPLNYYPRFSQSRELTHVLTQAAANLNTAKVWRSVALLQSVQV